MKLIPLTREKFAQVDDQDYEELCQYRWYARPNGRNWYAERNFRADGKKRYLSMHTAITGYRLTDHVDGDGLNNRRSNLREASFRQNQYNARHRSTSRSRFKGVWFNPSSGKWRARITVAGSICHLGYLDTPEEAALAYDAAAREVCGPYGTYNFPLPGERSALTGELVPA